MKHDCLLSHNTSEDLYNKTDVLISNTIHTPSKLMNNENLIHDNMMTCESLMATQDTVYF